MKIKVCGLKDPDNILALSALPIDYMGFIFYEKSPRFVKDDSLVAFLKEHEEKLQGIGRVGVFVDHGIDVVFNKVHDFELDLVQLHGNESPEYCREIKSFWESTSMRRANLVKAFSVDDDFDFEKVKPYEGLCSFFLFDTKGQQPGGNGTPFNWDKLKEYEGFTPYFLSGGVDPGAVQEIKKLDFKQLYAIDINSRFEKEPGLKDVSLVGSFVKALKG